MKDKYLLLDQLRSTDKKTRRAALTELRGASCIPPEITYALEQLSLDSDSRTAHAASKVLRYHRFKKFWRKVGMGILVVITLGFIIFMISLSGLTSKLTCVKATASGRVDCIEQVYFFSLVPLYNREVMDVRIAEILTSTDSDGYESYLIELVAGSETYTLDAVPSMDYRSKRMVVDEINQFLASDINNALTIDDRGILTVGDAIICIGPALVLLVVYLLIKGLSVLWKNVRPVRNRSSTDHYFIGGSVCSDPLKQTRQREQSYARRLDAYTLRNKGENSPNHKI